MCGIIGGWWPSRPNKFDSKVAGALARLQNRGPDDKGFNEIVCSNGLIGLGQTRLSIIDLSSGGHQPMVSKCKRYTLVYNGEIYNYKELRHELNQQYGIQFETSSDTEVLLKAYEQWGLDCLPRLTGMFAFGIYDNQSETITCVRDAFGIKPLFYSVDPEQFLFSSTLPAHLEFITSPKASMQRSYDYLVHGDYDSNENTFIENIKHVSPGNLIVFSTVESKIIKSEKWWTPKVEENHEISFDSAVERVRELFLKNVRLHLRSDVPLGAALSGGIDSSAIVCAIRHLEPQMPIHTFSYIAGDQSISEEKWVDQVTDSTGSKSHKVLVTADELLHDLDDFIYGQGEPVSNTSMYAQYRVYKLAKEAGITVTLDGQGADEQLAGYAGYPGQRLLSLIETSGYGSALKFASSWSKSPGRRYKQSWMEYGRLVMPDNVYAFSRRKLGRDFMPNWLDQSVLGSSNMDFRETRLALSDSMKGRRVIERLADSLQNRGLPALLRQGDRNSMVFSIESRVPFLTTDMTDLLLSLPEHYLIDSRGTSKSVFRSAMRGIVPDTILDRSDKIGLATPDKKWMKALQPTLRKTIQESHDIPYLNSEELLKHFDLIMSGKIEHSWQIWRWFNYIRWHQKFVD